MKINPNVAILEIPVDFGSGPTTLNLTAIIDKDGATLFDTGMPGQEQLILEALAKEGVEPSGLKRIVITHADSDHIGSMKALKDLTGAEVICLDVEADYVSGAVPPYKSPPPKVLEENPEFKALLESIQRIPADTLVKDGETIPGTDAVAVATPGHTLGHMSVYIPEGKILITGDALTAADGVLDGPMERATPDMVSAKASVKKLAGLDVEKIVAYHGGLVDKDAKGQLGRVSKL
jgi:glyoxylase-like metal-dependent hydrolase (beta-lactamase superfamily II)